MNKNDIKKAAEVMLAYADDKQIQRRNREEPYNSNDEESSWHDVSSTYFNWYKYEYRIKPESKVVPFTFDDRNLFMNKIIQFKKGLGLVNEYIVWTIVSCDSAYVWIGVTSEGINYDELLREYTFEDGSPCGKIIE